MTNVVDRIKKLLRLGQSPNPHEAELAMNRAFDLAARHHINIADLELEEEAEEIEHRWFQPGNRDLFLRRRVGYICIVYFNVNIVRRSPSGDMMFIGLPSDVTIAWYVYEFLVRHARRFLREFEQSERRVGRRMNTNKRQSFLSGFIYGISAQLKRQKDEIVLEDTKFAIVLSRGEEQRTAYQDRLFPDIGDAVPLRTPKKFHGSALSVGYTLGKELRINQPIRGRSEVLQLT